MDTSTTTFTRLQLHLERHKYTKGQFKGDAPAENRSATHFRVVKHSTYMAVRMHGTDIITAYPDGRVTIDCRGWAGHTTTKERLNYALARFFPALRGYLHSCKFKGLSQLCLGSVVYYDGITFDANGVQLSEPKPFMMRRINREKSTTLRREIKASGFADTFKLLHATATPDMRPRWIDTSRLADKLTDSERACDWPEIIAHYKWTSAYRFALERDASACWQAIMAECKSRMYELVPSDVTRL